MTTIVLMPVPVQQPRLIEADVIDAEFEDAPSASFLSQLRAYLIQTAILSGALFGLLYAIAEMVAQLLAGGR